MRGFMVLSDFVGVPSLLFPYGGFMVPLGAVVDFFCRGLRGTSGALHLPRF
jgi:hypothetical protein